MKAYFQYLMLDASCMNSEVVRVFQTKYHQDDEVDINSISNDRVAFHTHIVVSAGIKQGLWHKIGHVPLGDFSVPTFRNTLDENEEVSNNWSIWKTGQPWQFIGSLNNDQKKLDTASIIPPAILVHKVHYYPDNRDFDPSFFNYKELGTERETN